MRIRNAVILSIFILGALSGCMLASFRYGLELEKAYIEKEYLTMGLQNMAQQIDALQESLNQTERMIETVDVKLTTLSKPPGMTLDEMRLKKEITALTNPILGRKLNGLDPLLVEKILDERLIVIDGKTVKISVTKLILSENVFFEVSAKVVSPSMEASSSKPPAFP